MDSVPLYWSVVCSITAVKLLLIPSYKSTDFEVHRNWLAITHNLPIGKWYYEATSPWTLDYPPLFAWFEWALSLVASFVDPNMLNLGALNYSSWSTLVFMRASVILTDLVYAYAVYRCCNSVARFVRKSKGDVWADEKFILCMLLMTNVGLLMVDHIHFQYNGFLYGLLLLSVDSILQGRNLESALWFSLLINFKHLYVYVAPAFFVYFLRNYCFKAKSLRYVDWRSFSPYAFLKLGLIVISVFLATYGPFLVPQNHLPQIFDRLFPFKRGLTHSYWAPNFWALYNFADKVIAFIGVKFGLLDRSSIVSNAATRGLVQEYEHSVLPSISPLATLVLASLFMLPTLLKLWSRAGQPLELIRSVALCAFASFMFGWHVHEKAILMILIPLTLLVLTDINDAKSYLILATVGHFSLTPLLFKEAETPTKFLMLILFASYAFFSLSLKHSFSPRARSFLPLLSPLETLYLVGLLVLQGYNGIGHWLLGFAESYPFVPLMTTSVYCALGVTYVWGRMNWISWKGDRIPSSISSRKKR